MYQRFVFHKVTGWKNSQNLPDNTCVGVSFFIKLQIIKFAKLKRELLCWSLVFYEITGWKISENSKENTCVGVSFLLNCKLKNFAKVTGKQLWRSLVFNEAVGLQLKQVLFYGKNLLSWNITDFAYCLSYTMALKNFTIIIARNVNGSFIFIKNIISVYKVLLP